MWSTCLESLQQEMPNPDRLDDAQRLFLKIIARIIAVNSALKIIGIKQVSTDGEVMFSVRFQDLGIAKNGAPLVRHLFKDRFYVDFVGELLLRRQFHAFFDWLGDNAFYETAAKMAR